MEERRKHKRLSERMIVVYKLPKEAKIEKIAKTEDIGIGGIRIVIPKNVIKGDIISLDISVLNDAIPMIAKGEVVWIRAAIPKKGKNRKNKDSTKYNFAVGIKFNKFERFDDERMIRYINKKIKDEEA